MTKHWSKVEYLHQTVTNPNIVIKGTHSYYSDAWSGSFEESVVRYLYGDAYSRENWTPKWHIDKLYVGDFVSIAPEVVILMGGNHTHRTDWFSCYAHLDKVEEEYREKGDTVIGDGVWLGMRSIIMPSVKIGEGAIVAAGAVVTKNVEPYCIVAGNPAKLVKKRFTDEVIERLLRLNIYSLSPSVQEKIHPYLCGNDIDALEKAIEIFSKDV